MMRSLMQSCPVLLLFLPGALDAVLGFPVELHSQPTKEFNQVDLGRVELRTGEVRCKALEDRGSAWKL